MKILNLYVTRGFLLAFCMAIGILTFGMTGANLVKVLDYVSQGIPLSAFVRFTLYILPIVLTFTVPWAVMVAVMLVFGRLSADSEITAMRACGVSILQIISPIMLLTVLLTGVCLYLQTELGPPLLGKSRQLMKIEAIHQPMAIFEPGRVVRHENYIISIDEKEGENKLKGIQIFALDKNGGLGQDISASDGEISVDRKNRFLLIKLFNCMIINKGQNASGSRENSDGELRIFNEQAEIKLDYGRELNDIDVGNRAKFMTLKELMGRIRLTQKMNRDTTELEVELNQRIAFALSPIAFLLLGLPLAIRTSRKETSVGIFLSVILAGLFFLSIILCESLTNFPKLYPQYLLWLPNILFQILGAVMTFRISQR